MLRRLLRQLTGAAAATPAALIARGRAERERGEPAASIMTLQTVLQQAGEDCVALAELGLSYRALGRLDEARRAFERDYLIRILKITAGNVTHAARLAGRNRTEFYRLLERHALEPAVFKRSANAEV